MQRYLAILLAGMLCTQRAFTSCAKPAALNGDGMPDSVVVNLSSGLLSALIGNGGGAFLPAVNYTTGQSRLRRNRRLQRRWRQVGNVSH